MPPKRKASQSPPPTSSAIFRSTPIEDRHSKFLAFYSPTLSAKDLQAHAEFVTASHRVAAWRTSSKQRLITSGSQPARQIFDTGHDDDGEKYAGKKLEDLLNTMKVEGAVVVARWFGNVMLGPVRFTHFLDCARAAILQNRLPQGNAHKKQKEEGEDETARKEKLEAVLKQRDNSINTLRNLLTEKKGGSSTGDSSSSPMRQISYNTMPLPALVKLEKARDATIAWLLQEIDKVEKSALATDAPPHVEDKNISHASIQFERGPTPTSPPSLKVDSSDVP